MKHSHKDYNEAFLLEPTKLQRIVDTVHDRLADFPSALIRDDFEVFLSGNRREELGALYDVLELDNSKKRRIERLVFVSSASLEPSGRPEYEVQVDFGAEQPSDSDRSSRIVSISVKGESTGWVARTLSEVEEQVERTWLNRRRPIGVLAAFLAVILVVLVFQLSAGRAGSKPEDLWLKADDLDRVEAMLRERDTLSLEDLRIIATSQLRNALEDRRAIAPYRQDLRLTLLLGVPLLVMFILVIILLTTCYPKSVFLWRDGVERYERLLTRRKVLWNLITGVMVIGLLSTFLAEGIGTRLPPAR